MVIQNPSFDNNYSAIIFREPRIALIPRHFYIGKYGCRYYPDISPTTGLLYTVHIAITLV